MSKYFDKVLGYTNKLSLEVITQDQEEEILVVSNEEKGVFHLILDCEFPILIMEQLIYNINTPSLEHFQRLLQMNRYLVHGAFVIDEESKHVLFRDTLQLENLDFNELEGSVNALTIGLAEFSKELLTLNK